LLIPRVPHPIVRLGADAHSLPPSLPSRPVRNPASGSVDLYLVPRPLAPKHISGLSPPTCKGGVLFRWMFCTVSASDRERDRLAERSPICEVRASPPSCSFFRALPSTLTTASPSAFFVLARVLTHFSGRPTGPFESPNLPLKPDRAGGASSTKYCGLREP